MSPEEFDLKIQPLLARRGPNTKETSTPLKPRPRPCEYCQDMVDQQVIQIYRKWLANEPYTYKKCAVCHVFLEKKNITDK